MAELYAACTAFFGLLLLDLLYAVYTKAMVGERHLFAALYALMMQACTGAVTLAYVHEPVMLLPAMGGAFIGTYIGSKL